MADAPLGLSHNEAQARLTTACFLAIHPVERTARPGRLRRARRALFWVTAVTTALLSLILLWPSARDLFRFGALHVNDLMATLAATVLLIVTLEVVKRFWRIQGMEKTEHHKIARLKLVCCLP